jgi:hypothetical protein
MRQALIDAYMKVFLGRGIEWDEAMFETLLRVDEDLYTMSPQELRFHLSDVREGRTPGVYEHQRA